MTLRDFYVAYAAWLDAGAPDQEPFCREVGLCSNLMRFFGDCIATAKPWEYIVAKRQLLRDFTSAGLDSSYPFGQEDYHDRFNDDTMHLCPKRNAWVRKHAGDES